MSFERELLETLEQGTALVVALTEGEVSVDEFLREYDNFYHYHALDGHEAAAAQRAVFDTVRPYCAFHEQVQAIVYLVYRSETPLLDYEAAGRILPVLAGQRIVALARDAGATDLLGAIRGRIGTCI